MFPTRILKVIIAWTGRKQSPASWESKKADPSLLHLRVKFNVCRRRFRFSRQWKIFYFFWIKHYIVVLQKEFKWEKGFLDVSHSVSRRKCTWLKKWLHHYKPHKHHHHDLKFACSNPLDPLRERREQRNILFEIRRSTDTKASTRKLHNSRETSHTYNSHTFLGFSPGKVYKLARHSRSQNSGSQGCVEVFRAWDRTWLQVMSLFDGLFCGGTCQGK